MMGNHTLDTPLPLAPAVESLLAFERVITPQPERVRARAVARARASLRAADLTAARPARGGASSARRLVYAAAASVLLLAGGAAAYQMLRTPEPAETRSAPPAKSSSGARATASLAAPAPATPAAPDLVGTPVAPSKATAASPRGTVATKSAATPEELRLLVRARQADARAEYFVVLSLLNEHERSFPTGRLSEEREALRVKALVGLGRGAEARQAAARFGRSFPRSVLLHKLEDMIATLR